MDADELVAREQISARSRDDDTGPAATPSARNRRLPIARFGHVEKGALSRCAGLLAPKGEPLRRGDASVGLAHDTAAVCHLDRSIRAACRATAVVAGLLGMLLQSALPAVAGQAQNAPRHDAVLGEDPLVLQLRPPEEPPAGRARALALGPEYRLHVVYLIPGNRTAQPGAETTLRNFVLRMQAWFREHMERLGYAPKTFAYETEADGITPKIEILDVDEPDTYFHGDYLQRWDRVLSRVSAAGVPLWQQGVLTLVIAEMHVQEPDGRLRENSTFVGGAGTPLSGTAMVTGDALARLSESFLTDDRPYDGLVIPAVGPYPLVQNVTFPWFEGSTVSSTSSSAQGAVIHELGHALYLWHDFRNDSNFNGNLMGNGLRGLRGSLFPQRYPADDVGLSLGSAIVLNYSRFFNSAQTFTDQLLPWVDLLTAGTAFPVRGLCELSYFAYDMDSLLGGALLIRGGQVVGEVSLDLPAVTGAIATYDYTPGVSDSWNVLVIDQQGLSSVSAGAPLQCAPGFNRAPQPQIHITTTWVRAGDPVRLDATGSTDPDGSWPALMVRWDLDGDGTFDTSATTTKTRTIAYTRPGVYQVIAELTDEQGDSSRSVPIGVRVDPRLVSVAIDIKPGDEQNSLNPRAQGGIWVAVLSASGFDPQQIDVGTVRFGPGEAAPIRSEVSDLNGDGVGDLALRFAIPESGIGCGDTDAALTGGTTSGWTVSGSDAIRTVGCQGNPHPTKP